MSRTLKQLIECYQTDPHSNFLRLQYQVRVKHGRLLARLSEEHGNDQLRNVRFRNLTVWYNAWVSDGKIARARSMVDRLRELFRFGATLLEIANVLTVQSCREFRSRVRLRAPFR